jgi:diguanylate cyclase (GGDEF)-like protein
MDDELEELLEILRTNEEKARKLLQIELKILSIDNFRGLFEELLTLIEEKFKIPHVWISIVEDSDLSHLLEALQSSQLVRQRLNLVSRDALVDLFGDKGTPILANEDLRRFYRLFPKSGKYLVKSLAMTAITLEGSIVGSLNMGDSTPDRFQPDMDSFFPYQLGVKVSICLANVMAHERLQRLASRDPLTDLPNRREMDAILKQELTQAARYGHALALLFIDCDDFKRVNDTYGHDCGDALLRYVAGEMRRIMRASDKVFRFAGDEFVIILPHQSSREALQAAERLGAFFRNHPLKFADTFIPISLSCGTASTDQDETSDAASFLKAADQRLYHAKVSKQMRTAGGSHK